MNNLSTYLSTFAVFVAAIAWLYAVKCWSFCRDTEKFMKKLVDPAGKYKKIAKLSSEMTDLKDSMENLLESHAKLRSRIGMRRQRAKPNGSENAIPDSTTDPAGYKRAMRLELQSKGLLR